MRGIVVLVLVLRLVIILAGALNTALASSSSSSSSSRSSGCLLSEPGYPTGRSDDWLLTPDGLNRTFHVYVPTDTSTSTTTSTNASPVLFVLHGGFGTGTSAELRYGMDSVADANGFIVVYPDGYRNAWNGGDCCGAPMVDNTDDVGFLSSVLDRIQAQLCVDTTRSYASGMSNGAIMAYRLGCQLASRIAAIGIIEGTLEYFPCQPAFPVAVFATHGTADLNIPFTGGVGCGPSGANFTAVPVALDTFARANQCQCTYEQAATCSSSYLNLDDAICTQYGSACAFKVVMCRIQGAGHTWSGAGDMQTAGSGCNHTVGTFPASTQMWSFVSQYARVDDTPTTTVAPSSLTPTATPSGAATASPATALFFLIAAFVAALFL